MKEKTGLLQIEQKNRPKKKHGWNCCKRRLVTQFLGIDGMGTYGTEHQRIFC
jgi:hypothetical protein